MLGLPALALSSIAWLEYLARIPKERVPERPTVHAVLQAASLVLAVAALIAGESPFAPIAALVLAGFFLWLLTQARMPSGTITVAVGDRVIPFSATRTDGAPFSTDEIAGRRILLKFFRGDW